MGCLSCAGTIAEFNPFHKGHAYLVSEMRRLTGADVVAAVMSGDFTQRGEFTVYDKWKRAELAINSGVDIVFRLPSVYACSSAPNFAAGSVDILQGVGTDYIAFGSESGSIEELMSVSELLTSHRDEISDFTGKRLREGISYPRAREEAVKRLTGSSDAYTSILREPNNILALEYLGNITTSQPITIKRVGSGYHSSASAIRSEFFYRQPYLDAWERYFLLLRTRVVTSDPNELERRFSTGDGLCIRIFNEARRATSLEDWLMAVKSKVYTMTAVKRMFTRILLGIDNDEVDGATPYLFPLAMSGRGAAWFKQQMKAERVSIPVVRNIKKSMDYDDRLSQILKRDVGETDIYNILFDRDLYKESDYVRHTEILR